MRALYFQPAGSDRSLVDQLNQRTRDLYKSGDPAGAMDAARLAAETAERLPLANRLDAADSFANLGLLLNEAGRPSEAEPWLRRALKICRHVSGDSHPRAIEHASALGSVLAKIERHEEAEELLLKALRLQRSLKWNGGLLAEVLLNLAFVYQSRGLFGRAEPLLIEAREITRKADPENPDDYITVLNNLAHCYKELQRLDLAELFYREALDILISRYGEAHPPVIPVLNNLGRLKHQDGALKEAWELLQRALQASVAAHGWDHRMTSTLLNNLGTLTHEIGRLDLAQEYLERSIAVRAEQFGTDHPEYAIALNNLALVCEDAGDVAAAERLFTEAVEILRRRPGPLSPYIVCVLPNLAVLYNATGRYALARSSYDRAIDDAVSLFGATDPRVAKLVLEAAQAAATAEDAGAALRYRQLLDRAATDGDPSTASPADAPAEEHSSEQPTDATPPQPDEPLLEPAAEAARLREASAVAFNSGHLETARDLAGRAVSTAQTLGRGLDLGLSLAVSAAVTHALGNLSAAESLYDAAVPLLLESPLEGAEAGLALNNAAEVYRDVGRYAEAERLYRQCLEFVDRALPAPDPTAAVPLTNLAHLFSRRREHHQARLLYQRALELRLTAYGEDHPLVDVSRQNLENCKAAEIREAVVSRFLADDPIGLARHCLENGDAAGADEAYARAVEICRRTGGAAPEFVDAVLEAGFFSIHYADPQRAADRFGCALEMCRQAGREDLQLTYALNGAGIAAARLGDFARAESAHTEALELRTRLAGPRTLEVAQSLDNLAEVYRLVGAFDAALPLYHQAVEIWAESGDRRHPAYAMLLSNLASCYGEQGSGFGGLPLLEEAYAILRDTLGDRHPETLRVRHNLALARVFATGDPGLLEKVLHDQRVHLGEGHPDVGITALHLAKAALGRGDMGRAARFSRIATRILRPTRGARREFIHALFARAVIHARRGRPRNALAALRRVAMLDRARLRRVFGITSDPERMQHLREIQRHLGTYLHLVAGHGDTADRERAVALVLGSKGMLADAWLSLRARTDAEHTPDIKEWRKLQGEVARLSLEAASPNAAPDLRATLAELLERRTRIERRLGPHLSAARETRVAISALARRVADALPPGAVLIDYYCYTWEDMKRRGMRTGATEYLAVVVAAGDRLPPLLVPLGDADEIDALVGAFRKGLVGRDEESDATRYDVSADPAVRLRERLIDPLGLSLAPGARLYISPDRDLTRLPFEALRLPSGEFMIDSCTISYLSTGRDLLLSRDCAGMPGRAVVLADPDYDLERPTSMSPPAEDLEVRRSFGSMYFNRLRGAQMEGAAVGELLGVEPRTGADALKAFITGATAPCILHMATHGFFLSDRFLTQGSGDVPSDTSGAHPFLSVEDPLLRAGLALAGANTWLAGKPNPEEVGNGIITAAEVAPLDLRGTELVVLSACETGLGKVRAGEGVFGFRRAFVQAGAKTLVMSLWKVADEPTYDLMVEFYRLLLAGCPRAEALRGAQLKIKAALPSPVFWAAFVCQGDSGPLPAYIVEEASRG